MNSAYLPAIAALAGSVIGGLTSLTAAWLTQIRQAAAQQLAQDRSSRQKLYKEFIDEAARLYGDALANSEAAVSDLVRIHALVSRMRVLSSSEIVEKAERVVTIVVGAYFSPNKTFPELCDMVNSHEKTLLRDFGMACREELRALCGCRF